MGLSQEHDRKAVHRRGAICRENCSDYEVLLQLRCKVRCSLIVPSWQQHSRPSAIVLHSTDVVSVRQYKYHLKKWDISKSISSSVKDQAIKAIRKRVRDGETVGGVRYKGEEVDKKRLRRYLDDQRRLSQDFRFSNIV